MVITYYKPFEIDFLTYPLIIFLVFDKNISRMFREYLTNQDETGIRSELDMKQSDDEVNSFALN